MVGNRLASKNLTFGTGMALAGSWGVGWAVDPEDFAKPPVSTLMFVHCRHVQNIHDLLLVFLTYTKGVVR